MSAPLSKLNPIAPIICPKINTPIFKVIPLIKNDIPKNIVPKNKDIFLPNLSAIIPVGISNRKIQIEKTVSTANIKA